MSTSATNYSHTRFNETGSVREQFPAEVGSRALSDDETSEIEHLMDKLTWNVNIDRQTEFKELFNRKNTLHKLKIVRHCYIYLSSNGISTSASRVVSAMVFKGIKAELLNSGNVDAIRTVVLPIYDNSKIDRVADVIQYMFDAPEKTPALIDFINVRDVKDVDLVIDLIDHLKNGTGAISEGTL